MKFVQFGLNISAKTHPWECVNIDLNKNSVRSSCVMADGCTKVLTFILKKDVFGFKVKCLSIIEGLHRHEKIEKYRDRALFRWQAK